MKVLHIPYCYFPDPIGGTEVYVQALAREQEAIGITPEVAAPAVSNTSYKQNGLTVRRFSISPELSLPQLYGEGDPVVAESFEKFALVGNPDLVHLHSYTPAVSGPILQTLKARNIPVVFTFHTPAVTCLRGDLLNQGDGVCGGEIRNRDCTICKLQSLGIAPDLAECLARVPSVFAAQAARVTGLLGRKVTTALQMRRLVELRNRSILEFLGDVDRIVAVCDWVREVLVRNRVNPQKIVMSRQGLPQLATAFKTAFAPPDEPLRLAYFGRLHTSKGVELLAEAVVKAEAKVALDIYGTVQDDDGEQILNRLHRLEGDSARIRVRAAIDPENVVSTLAGYHLLATPSQSMETGPLVIYEAFAAGVPVLGSNLGGISELVSNGKNGFLVRHDSVSAWVKAIEFLAQNPAVVKRLAANVRGPRSMSEVMRDMETVYASLIPCEALSSHP